jgi:hypothetical protein
VRGEQSGEQIVPNNAMFTHFWCSQSECKLLWVLKKSLRLAGEI